MTDDDWVNDGWTLLHLPHSCMLADWCTVMISKVILWAPTALQHKSVFVIKGFFVNSFSSPPGGTKALTSEFTNTLTHIQTGYLSVSVLVCCQQTLNKWRWMQMQLQGGCCCCCLPHHLVNVWAAFHSSFCKWGVMRRGERAPSELLTASPIFKGILISHRSLIWLPLSRSKCHYTVD